MTTARRTQQDRRRATALKKALRALELRTHGFSYEDIAQNVGFANRQNAHRAVKKAMEHLPQEATRDMRDVELLKLDRLESSLWSQAESGDTASVTAILKVMERRAKLTGLDKPIKVDIRERLISIALTEGLDPDEAIAAAEQHIASLERQGYGR